MADEREDIGRLWREQPSQEDAMRLEDIKAKARKLRSTIWWRNAREDAAAAFVLFGFGRMLLNPDAHGVTRLGALLVIAATIFVVGYMHLRGSVAAAPEGGSPSIDFYRGQLERQRDLLRSVAWWYLLPFVPGFLLVLIGRVAAEPQRATNAAAGTVIALAVFIGIWALNAYGARKLQQEIDALGER